MASSHNEPFYADSPKTNRGITKFLAQSRSTWRPPGTPVIVAGRTIDSGMIYVGAPIPAIARPSLVEPSLIDPSLPVGQDQAWSLFYGFYYLRHYAQLQPSDRERYLDWLSAGRPAGALDSEVVLFLAGIERRLLFDARYDLDARAEMPALLEEVERLLHLFPDSYGLQSHASNLLMAVRLLSGSFDPREAELSAPMRSDYWGLPQSLLIPVGTLVARGMPISANWALSWFYCHPNTYVRTAAERCAPEFRTLFLQNYQNLHGAGFLVKRPKRQFTPAYWPANSGLGQSIPLGSERLPDVSRLQRPIIQLQQIAEMATDALAAYSRAIGSGWDRESCAALAYLPEALGDIPRVPSVVRLTDDMDKAIGSRPFAVVSVASILRHFLEFSAKPTPKQATALAHFLRRLGYELNPDPETDRTAFNSAGLVTLFRLDAENGYSRRDLEGPWATLALCALVADATSPLSEPQQEAIIQYLSNVNELGSGEVSRLRARLAWLTMARPKPATAGSLVKLVPAHQAPAAGRLLVEIANASSAMSPATIKLLSKLFVLLGLDSDQLHADLHRASTRGPARIIEGEPGMGFGIPRETHEIVLDPHQLERVQQQTADITGLLEEVFGGEAPALASSRGDSRSSIDPYIQLIEQLISRSVWEMAEITALAASLELMASGAIETINDRAVALGLEPPIECDDIQCDVDQLTMKELLAHV